MSYLVDWRAAARALTASACGAGRGIVAGCLVLCLSVAPARADVFELMAGDGVIGSMLEVRARYEDTLTDIARRHGLGYDDIVRANPGIDPWLPGEQTPVRLPTQFVLPQTPREGIVINIAEYRLYYYEASGGVLRASTFPISIGRMDWSTPIGRWAVTNKVRNPAWYPPESIRAEHLADGRGFLPKVVPPGPDNPLGEYAMRLSIPGYLIHGTNRPVGIGMRVTHGCIRMYPEDIEWLFPAVSVQTPVRIVNQPYKLGWDGDVLYLEAHPPLDEDSATRERDMTPITELYVQVTSERPASVDWELVEQVYLAEAGLPVAVGRALPAGPAAARSLARR